MTEDDGDPLLRGLYAQRDMIDRTILMLELLRPAHGEMSTAERRYCEAVTLHMHAEARRALEEVPRRFPAQVHGG